MARPLSPLLLVGLGYLCFFYALNRQIKICPPPHPKTISVKNEFTKNNKKEYTLHWHFLLSFFLTFLKILLCLKNLFLYLYNVYKFLYNLQSSSWSSIWGEGGSSGPPSKSNLPFLYKIVEKINFLWYYKPKIEINDPNLFFIEFFLEILYF